MKEIWTEGRGRVPRRVRQLRHDLVVAEAGAEAAPADPARRRTADATLQRVVDYCDGWLPIGDGGADLRADRCAASPLGRSSGARSEVDLDLAVFWAPPDRRRARRYGEMGVERGIFALPPEGRDETLARLDELAPLVGQVG